MTMDLRLRQDEVRDGEVTSVLGLVISNLPDFGEDREVWREYLRSLTAGQRSCLVTLWLDAEVRNGGFKQYFGNSLADFAPETVVALDFLEATQHLRILRTALGALDPPFSTDWGERAAALDELMEESWTALQELDRQYYALQRSGETLESYWQRCIETHPGDFFFQGPLS